MNNTDEAVHGFYIGHKHQEYMKTLSREKQKEAYDYALDLFMKLYENEVEYTELLYGNVGLVDKAMAFVHFNGNAAMHNLGYPAVFPEELCVVDEAISKSLGTASGVTHDFFSVEGPSYFMATYEDLVPGDLDFLDKPSYRETLYS